jgi:hypothetical protein
LRASPCKWISRDETGRPSCVHGPAVKHDHWACPKKDREHNARYMAANREKVLEKRRSFYQDNLEMERERNRRWHKANPERVRENNARNNPRIVKVGQYYVGMAPTVEQAQQLNAETRARFA